MTLPIVAAILAGGKGARLAPLSTPERPKQLQALLHPSKTLLQQTAERTLGFTRPYRVVTLASASHAAEVEAQLAHVNIALARHILAEPKGRDTAAAVAAAVLYAKVAWSQAVLCILPADHAIGDVRAFAFAVKKAAEAAQNGVIATFGIAPTAPDSRYGYMVHGGVADARGAYPVERFHEKPEAEVARALIAAGQCFWNSGIFIATLGTFESAFLRHAPELWERCASALAAAEREEGITRLSTAYAAAPSLPVDKAIMERASNLVVFPAAFDWLDIGTPEGLDEARRRAPEPV